MNILVAVGGVNALFLSILVQTKKDKIPADHLLAIFLLLVSAAFGLVFGALEHGHEGLLLFLTFSNLLYAPLFYRYVEAMAACNGACWSVRKLRDFLPWLASVIYLLVILDRQSPLEITRLFQQLPFSRRPWLFNAFYGLDLVFVPLYLWRALRALKCHRRRMADRFSDLQTIDFNWLHRVVVAVAVLWGVIEVPLRASALIPGLTEHQGLVLGFSLASIMIFYLGVHGFRQRAIPVSKPGKYLKSSLDAEEIPAYRKRLIFLMVEKRLFLDSSLTLRNLAGQAGLSEHNASEVINVGLGVSFHDFVNNYRVEEFKTRAADPENQHLTLLALALECGFNSKSSFNRIFKKATGTTPSRYLKHRRGGDSSGGK